MSIKIKNYVLCNEGGFVGKFVNEGDLGLPRRGDIAMREIGPKWGSLPQNGGALATMIYIDYALFDILMDCLTFHSSV